MMKLIPFTLLLLLFSFSTIAQDTLNKTDENGLKQGYWIKKNERGVKVYEGRFVNDVPVDTFLYYDINGDKNARLVWLDAVTSMATIYYPDGTKAGEGKYVNKQKEGLWKLYDGNEILSAEQHWKNGKKHGSYKVYYDDGSVSVDTYFENGLEHGFRKEFWLDGKRKFEGNYVDGNPDGEVKYYNEEGQLTEKGTYKNAVRHGKWMHYGQHGIDKITIFEYGKQKEVKTISNED